MNINFKNGSRFMNSIYLLNIRIFNENRGLLSLNCFSNYNNNYINTNNNKRFLNNSCIINSNINSNINSISLSQNIINNNLNSSIKINDIHSMKGYKSYDLIYNMGGYDEFYDKKELNNRLNSFLEELSSNLVYTVLPVVSWYDVDSHKNKGLSICDSFKISKGIDINDLSDYLNYRISVTKSKYGIDDCNIELMFMYRVWLSDKDFNVSFDKVREIVNKELRESVKKDKDEYKLILKRINSNIQGEFTNLLMDSYGEELNVNRLLELGIDNKNDNLKYYKYSEDKILEVLISYDYNKDGNLEQRNKVKVKIILDGKLSTNVFNSWNDIKIVNERKSVLNHVLSDNEYDNSIDNSFIRDRGDVKFFYVNGKIEHMEYYYNFPNINVARLEQSYNDKIGSIDLETLTDDTVEEEDEGLQFVCGIGFKANNIKSYKILSVENYDRNIILEIIDEIFENKLYNYSFYVHNLGRFDSVFIINEITANNKYEVKGVWKSDENKILSLKIVDKESRKSITIFDSLSFFNNKNLRKVLLAFKCKNKKGIFPYSFLNKKTLNYIGPKPDYKYYDKISEKEYNKIRGDNWNCRKELLKYMKSDIDGLYEVIMKMSKNIFDKYNINLTSYKTLPALTMAIFTSNFYNEDDEITVIKGTVEKDIRSSYFGGIVDTYNKNIIENAYYYDMNYQYPYAMLNYMPVGNPIFTTETNLDNIFGYVYGEVIPPSKDKLLIPLIPKRVNNRVIMAREPFKC
jgi:DNA polymerase type B, organellar and viral